MTETLAFWLAMLAVIVVAAAVIYTSEEVDD
jgi:hypothetical protein